METSKNAIVFTPPTRASEELLPRVSSLYLLGIDIVISRKVLQFNLKEMYNMEELL